jgi:hypothetical protein
MLSLISRITNRFGWLMKQSLGKLLPVLLVGFLLMTTNGADGMSERKLEKVVDRDIHQDSEKRPKTTGEWNKQSRETQGKPGERLKRVGEQSAEAIKDFGSVFPDTVERGAAELENMGKAVK